MVTSAMNVERLETHQKNHRLNPINTTKGRRLTYSKRKDCIKKKTMELGILCGTDTCTVILGSEGDVETWPENPTHVKSILGKYREHREHGKKKPVRRTGEKKVDPIPSVGLLGWNDDWASGLSAGELWSLLGDLDLKLEAVENRVGFLNKEQGNGLGFPLDDCYWPMEQSVLEPLVSGYSCSPLNTQPLGFYGHQLVPVVENHLRPFSMDEKTLRGLGSSGFVVEPVATPSEEESVGFDGDSYQNDGRYASDYFAQEFVPRDAFYSQISPQDEAPWGTTVNGNPIQFVDNEFGEGAAFNFDNGSFHCSQGELQLW